MSKHAELFREKTSVFLPVSTRFTQIIAIVHGTFALEKHVKITLLFQTLFSWVFCIGIAVNPAHVYCKHAVIPVEKLKQQAFTLCSHQLRCGLVLHFASNRARTQRGNLESPTTTCPTSSANTTDLAPTRFSHQYATRERGCRTPGCSWGAKPRRIIKATTQSANQIQRNLVHKTLVGCNKFQQTR